MLRAAHPLPAAEDEVAPVVVSADDQGGREDLAERLAEMNPEDFGEYEN